MSRCLGSVFNSLYSVFYSLFVFLTMLGMVFAAPLIGAGVGIATVLARGFRTYTRGAHVFVSVCAP